MSELLSFFIILLVLGSIFFYSALIYFTRITIHHDEGKEKKAHTSFDGITELNEPLPIWWLTLFVLSIIFGIIYLILYPGLGKSSGMLNWTAYKDHDERTVRENKIYDPMYTSFYKDSIETLSVNLYALKIGRSLFINNCSLCHGFDARGGNGFPNLRNNKWLYGGTPNDIKNTITNGRRGKMPGYMSAITSDSEIENTALYILSLSKEIDKTIITDVGKNKFNTICSACHGINAKGNKFIGAPDLTDPQWIYGDSLNDIKNTIKNGRSGVMPAHKTILSKEQIHILTAYIYSLNKI
ncbi:MAG TPA: cytochrome-c oxidase, cbb3-type subunit III [Candidatus Azoamicus sp. OHIO2]